MTTALRPNGLVLSGRLVAFDPRLGWGRIAAAGRLYFVRVGAFVNGPPPAGTEVEFTAVDGVHAREALRVRPVGTRKGDTADA
jgi:hypothetical protein